MENIQNTVIHLVQVEEYWAFARKMLKNTASQQIPPHTRVILCLEATRDCHKELIPAGIPVPGNSDAEKLTIIYKLVPATGAQESKWEYVSMPQGHFNFRFHWHLTQFFREYVITANAADRYFLFTWGHGASYALFQGGLPENSEAGESVAHLSIDHLCRAITDTSTYFRPFKISVVVMINCYMQTMETGYELSLAETDYLVAPENFGSWEGYDYTELFKTLFSTPGISSKDFAALAVSTLNDYEQTVQNSFSPLSDSVVSAVNLQKYRELFLLTDQLAVQLLKLPDQAMNSLFKIKIPPASTHETIDLYNFLIVLQKNICPGFPVIKPAVNNLLHLLTGKDLVIESFTGDENTQAFKGIAIGIYGFGTPARSPYYNRFMDLSSPFASTFTKTNTWGIFTAKYP